MKAAPVIRALAALGHDQRVVHTGQHYDERMSEVFFVQLGLPRPDVNLGVGSGSHARQTAEVLTGMEREFTENSPALAVVYGDVNSALGAALAAAKLGVPLAHVEAGLGSFDDSMPEEINRRLTDQLCSLLFVTSPKAIGHLAREGRPASAAHLVGNPMIDTLLASMDRFDVTAARTAFRLPDGYVVATFHRPSNVDDPAAAATLVRPCIRWRTSWTWLSRCIPGAAPRSRRPVSACTHGCTSLPRSATSSSSPWSGAPGR
jgi:UDP-N-acetylglucosamine 2-epimerase (non-hydrolysing)